MQGLFADLSDSGLMQAMGITRGTLRTYFARLFTKVGTRSRSGLILHAHDIIIRDMQKQASSVRQPTEAKPFALPPMSNPLPSSIHD